MNLHRLRVSAEAYGLHRDVIRERVYDCQPCTRSIAGAYSMAARLTALRGNDLRSLEWALKAAKLRRHDGRPALADPILQTRISRLFYANSSLEPVSRNPLLKRFASSPEARTIRRKYGNLSVQHRVRMRSHEKATQNSLIVLKEFDEATGEKGVLLVAYTENIRRFAALFNVSRLADRYMLVFEPSWWGYQSTSFLLYLGCDLDVTVQAQAEPDHRFLEELDANLRPVPIGAGDWVDPETFCPPPDLEGNYSQRTHDVAIVGSWKPAKRHDEMFSAISRLAHELGRPDLTVAVVGFPAGWSREHIEVLIERHGVRSNCEIFAGIPHEEVADVLSDSRVYVLSSRREGANRAIYEALFCDTPVVVYENHRGVRTADIVPEVGLLYGDGELAGTLDSVLQDPERFSPREWALRNTGYLNASRELNRVLKRTAERRGSPWTRDIVPKKNAFNLAYADPDDRNRFADEYVRLATYLREQPGPNSQT